MRKQFFLKDGVQLLAAERGIISQFIPLYVLKWLCFFHFGNRLKAFLLIVLTLYFLFDHMTIVFANVHVDLVDHPADKLVTVVMVIVVELHLTGADTSDESLMV